MMFAARGGFFEARRKLLAPLTYFSLGCFLLYVFFLLLLLLLWRFLPRRKANSSLQFLYLLVGKSDELAIE